MNVREGPLQPAPSYMLPSSSMPACQEHFLSHVSAETLLVGHALENDLRALRTCHARILDSALLFPHPKGAPHRSALKVSMQRHGRFQVTLEFCTVLSSIGVSRR